MTTLRNAKTGETVETTLSNQEAAAKFAELMGDNTHHWMWFWMHKMVNEAAAKAAKPATVGTSKSAASFVSDSFIVAIGYGLKRPMIRVHFQGMRFKLYLSARGTVCLKAGDLIPGTQDPTGDEEYVGCYMPSGDFLPARLGYGNDRSRPLRTMKDTEREFLARLAESPVSFLAWCSKDMARCCYCYKALEDARSKAVGYGKTCAQHWGLPWGKDGYDEKTPSFATCWDANAAGIIREIRDNPESDAAWNVLGDWLEEKGLARCKKPQWSTVLPRS